MELLSFRILNYKSILDSGPCELSGDRITILAGQNEAGKTNILQALRDFDMMYLIDSDAIPDGFDDLIPQIFCTISITEKDIVDIDPEDFNTESLPIEVKSKIIEDGLISIIKFMPNEYKLDGNIMNIWQKSITRSESDNAKNDEIIENQPDIDLDSLESEFAKSIVKACPYFVYFESFSDRLPKKAYITQLKSILNRKGIPDNGDKAAIDFIKLAKIDINRLTEETDVKVIDNYLAKKCAVINEDFLNYWTQKVDGISQVKLSAELKNDAAGPYLSFFVRDGDLKMYPGQRSKGLLWFLSFYLRLNAESEQRKSSGSIILIDEPGSYLHAKAQNDVLKILEGRISKLSQVIFSTHSSELIDPTRLNRIRLVINQKKKGTKLLKITQRSQNDTDFADALSPIVTAIGKDLGSQFDIAAKQNVILEGISDFYYLSALRDKRGFRIPQEIKFIPMTGVFKIEYMASLMIGWGLDFIIIMDNESAANKEYRKLVRELDINPKKIFRIQGGRAIEDLFTKKDFKKSIIACNDHNAPAWDINSKYAKSLGKEVLAREFFENFSDTPITLEKETETNFGKIFAFIKQAFSEK